MHFSEIIKLQFDKKKKNAMHCVFLHFLELLLLSYLLKNAWLPPIFFLDSNIPC